MNLSIFFISVSHFPSNKFRSSHFHISMWFFFLKAIMKICCTFFWIHMILMQFCLMCTLVQAISPNTMQLNTNLTESLPPVPSAEKRILVLHSLCGSVCLIKGCKQTMRTHWSGQVDGCFWMLAHYVSMASARMGEMPSLLLSSSGLGLLLCFFCVCVFFFLHLI